MLAGGVVGRNLGAMLPGAVEKVKQPFEFLFCTVTILHVGGGNFISVKSNIMPAFFPSQGVSFRELTALHRVALRYGRISEMSAVRCALAA